VSEPSADQQFVVAIDVGTTSVKIAFDAQGREHGSADQGYPLLFVELYDDLTPAFRALARAERQRPDLAPTRPKLT
jgi:hypothetical protein